jgi:hypothetical protein
LSSYAKILDNRQKRRLKKRLTTGSGCRLDEH